MSAGTPSSTTLFLYEDDTALADEITIAFDAHGLSLRRLQTEHDLRTEVRGGQVDLLVMDRMIGERDSLGLLETLRAEGHKVPVIVISSRATVDDRILGLKAGGDDYLVKPFAMGELIARVEALRRRAAGASDTRLTVGPLTLDLISRQVRRGDREIALLPREFSLLEYLMRHAGHVVTRAMLLEDVWNYRASTQTNVVDVHVGNLRRKIDADGENKLIASVRGLGFKLADESGP